MREDLQAHQLVYAVALLGLQGIKFLGSCPLVGGEQSVRVGLQGLYLLLGGPELGEFALSATANILKLGKPRS